MTPYLLNLLDLALTLYALHIGCTELNPLMQSIPIMVAYKTIVVGGLCWGLQQATHMGVALARVGLNICTAVYAAVCAHNIYKIFLIGGV